MNQHTGKNKVKTRAILLLALCSISLNIFGDCPANPDSLGKKLEHATNDSVKANIYTELCWAHRYDTLAGNYGTKALQIFSKQKNIPGQCKILNIIGVSKRCKGRFFEALEDYFKVLSIAQQPSCNIEIAYAYNNIGDVYFRLEKYNQAMEYAEKSLLINQSIKNEEGVAYNLMLKCLILDAQQKRDQAIIYYKQALNIRLKLGLFDQTAFIYSSIGDCFMELNLSDSAFTYYKKAKDLGYNNSARYYLGLGKYYVSKKQYNPSIYNLKKCIEFSPGKEQQDILSAYRILQKIYFDLHDYKTAYMMQAKAMAINDSLQSTNNIKRLTQLEMNYEFEQKNKLKKIEEENREKLYKSKIEKQRIISYGLIVLLLAAITTVFFIVKNVRYIKKTNRILQEMNNEITDNHISIQRQYIELQELNSTKDKFFSIIAHDLRGPIGTFKSMIEHLVKDVDLTNTQKVHKLLHSTYKNASSTYDLLENLLLWAKSQRKEINYNPERLNLHEISETGIAVLKETAEAKKISIHNSIPENQIITGDANMLMTVIRNLVSNAIKFSNPGSSVYLSLISDNESVTVSIRDEGVGIDTLNLKRIFNLGEHFTTKGTASEKGSGLGLMLCKEFVERHGGKIWVESELNKGSNFKMSIPTTRTGS